MPPTTVLGLLSRERPDFDGAKLAMQDAKISWGVQILDDHDSSTLPYALRFNVANLSLPTIRRRLRSWEALERITARVSEADVSQIQDAHLRPFLETTGLDEVAHHLHSDHCFVIGEVIIPWLAPRHPLTQPQFLVDRVRSLIQGQHSLGAQ